MTTDSNHEASERLIQEKWKEELCPIISGIICGDGQIHLMDFSRISEGDRTKLELHITGSTNISSFLKVRCDYLTNITQLCEVRYPKENICIIGGEGGQGSEGFVAVSRLYDNYLEWIAFFEESNPFVSVRLDGPSVIAVSTYDDTWNFPLKHPEHALV